MCASHAQGDLSDAQSCRPVRTASFQDGMCLCPRGLGLFAAFSKMLPQSWNDQPRYGRHAGLPLLRLEPAQGAEAPRPFPYLLLGTSRCSNLSSAGTKKPSGHVHQTIDGEYWSHNGVIANEQMKPYRHGWRRASVFIATLALALNVVLGAFCVCHAEDSDSLPASICSHSGDHHADGKSHIPAGQPDDDLCCKCCGTIALNF